MPQPLRRGSDAARLPLSDKSAQACLSLKARLDSNHQVPAEQPRTRRIRPAHTSTFGKDDGQGGSRAERLPLGLLGCERCCRKKVELGRDKWGFSLFGRDGKLHDGPVGYYFNKVTIPPVVADGVYVLGGYGTEEWVGV